MKKEIGIIACVLALFLSASCGPKEGDLVTKVEISETEYAGIDYQMDNEGELCNFLDIDKLKEYFPGIENHSTKTLGLSTYGFNNGGCSLRWRPKESIERKQAGKYFHLPPFGSIDIRFHYNPNPEEIEKFAEKSINMMIKPKEDSSQIVQEMDLSYTFVKGVGSAAVWNDGSSSLDFALGQDYLLSISVNYPFDNGKRRMIAKEVALRMIQKLQS